jgi:hypothetical protein
MLEDKDSLQMTITGITLSDHLTTYIQTVASLPGQNHVSLKTRSSSLEVGKVFSSHHSRLFGFVITVRHHTSTILNAYNIHLLWETLFRIVKECHNVSA